MHNLYTQTKYRNLFLATAGVLFVALSIFFYLLGLVPQEIAPSLSTETLPAPETTYAAPQYESGATLTTATRPVTIEIPSVSIYTSVAHPQSKQVDVLDQALLSGAVYYPGSGTVEYGNMFVFGHSTGLSVVQNQAFKTFNNLKKVGYGDVVYVTGEDGQTYVYKAISTELVSDNEALVTFDTTDRMITLSTCNTFGAKEERYVVKAVFDRIL